MSNKQAINLTSLSLIQGELMATIEQASTHLETFISERDNFKVLEDCINSLQQIRGSLDLIQLYGACELAGDILATATQIDDEKPEQLDDKLAALTKGFFVLSCYFEYTQQHEVGMPVLLIPYINDIRLVNKQPLLPESYFEQADSQYRCPKGVAPSLPSDDDFSQMVRRFRHMYQVGLLGLVKELNVESSLGLMQRAMSKVHKLAQGSQSETLWWLASIALRAFAEGNISPSVTRKRVFSLLNKELRVLVKEGAKALESPLSEPLLKDLAYYVAISGVEDAEFQKVKQLFALDQIGYSETILQEEMVALTGPSANTVQSVAEVLRTELNVIKENIETIQSADCETDEGYEDTISRMQRVKEILNVVGLTSAGNVMAKPLEMLGDADAKHECLCDDGNMEVVNALLYVESVINSLDKRNFSGDKLAELNKLTQSEMISSHHLHDTQLVVIAEAEKGLATIKQLLTTFADSGYDKTHLEDIPTLLNELRGGVTILGLPRASAIITASTTFIEQTLMATEETAALEHMLETYADALICLEYYLDCMKVDKNVSTDTLAVAEESLSALGYPVS